MAVMLEIDRGARLAGVRIPSWGVAVLGWTQRGVLGSPQPSLFSRWTTQSPSAQLGSPTTTSGSRTWGQSSWVPLRWGAYCHSSVSLLSNTCGAGRQENKAPTVEGQAAEGAEGVEGWGPCVQGALGRGHSFLLLPCCLPSPVLGEAGDTGVTTRQWWLEGQGWAVDRSKKCNLFDLDFYFLSNWYANMNAMFPRAIWLISFSLSSFFEMGIVVILNFQHYEDKSYFIKVKTLWKLLIIYYYFNFYYYTQ